GGFSVGTAAGIPATTGGAVLPSVAAPAIAAPFRNPRRVGENFRDLPIVMPPILFSSACCDADCMTVFEALKLKLRGGVQTAVGIGGDVKKHRSLVFGVIALTLVVATAGFAEDKKHNKKKNADIENIGTRDINKGSINFISLNKEIALGRELSKQVEQDSHLVKDPEINEYVNRVAQNIVRNSDSKVPFTVKV